MRTMLATLSSLALGLWLGALCFFGAVLAPVAFQLLPGLFPQNPPAAIHAAGTIVGASLTRLHYLGFACGLIFILLILVLSRFAHWHSYAPQTILVLAMLVLTAYSQFFIIPKMDTVRDAVGGEITAVPTNNPGRQIFDDLHRQSTHVETVIAGCGLVAFLLGGRPQKPRMI